MMKRTAKKNVTMRGTVKVWTAVVMIATFFLSVFLYRPFYRRYYETVLTANEGILNAISVAIEENQKIVEHFMELLSYDKSVITLLGNKETAYSQVVREVFDVRELIAEREAMLSGLKGDIIIFSDNESIPASYWYVLPTESAKKMEGYQKFLESGQRGFWAGEEQMYPEDTVVSQYNRQSMLSYYKLIVDGISETGRLGVIKCGVDKAKFLEAASTTEVDGNLFIMQDGQVIYGETAEEIPDLTLSSSNGRCDTKNMIYLVHPMKTLHMDLVIALEKGKIIQQAVMYGLPQLLIILGTGIVMLLASRRFTGSIYRRIDQIVEVAQNAKSNYMEVTLPNSDDDDISALVDALNTLIWQIRSNAQARIEHEKKEKSALRLALQYQMNPHFLFNTLNWMQMCIELETESEKISEGIVLLGRLLRYNLNGEAYAPISQEIERTQDYIRLMNMRKNDAISLDVKVKDIDLEQPLMRFMLQPLCENAIQHGLAPGKQLHIEVSVCEKENEYIICVKNDGITIESEMIEEIMKKVQGGQGENGVGLANIYARIKLLYGEASDMTIASDQNETSVILKLKKANALKIYGEV